MSPLLITLVLTGCKPEPYPIDPPVGEFVETGLDVVAHEVAATTGNVPLSATVRAVNQFGASVPGPDQAFDVGGATVGVSFDGLGYGALVLDAASTVTVDDGTNTATLHGLGSEWPGFGMSRAFEAPERDALRADGVDGGAVVARGSELFWVGTTQAHHRVLNADGEIVGLQSGHIDVDGTKDVLAWTSNRVYLLRGRLGGGVAWGAALESGQFTVGGAAIGELNGDNLPDLAVVWSSVDGVSKLDEWHGDGLFGFTPAEPRNLPAIPISVSIGDSTGEGKAQITVLNEDGTWARFIAGSDVRYMPVGPRTPEEINVELGSTVDARGDLNADGGEELWFEGPVTAEAVRKIVVVDLVGTKIEFLPLSPMGAFTDRSDVDGNGIIDHVELHSTMDLRVLSFDETSTNSYTPRLLEVLPVHGPTVMDELVDRDGIPDLFVASNTLWWWWRGFNDPTDSDEFWSIWDHELTEVGVSTGPIQIHELDGNPLTTEIVGFEEQSGDTALTIWTVDTVTQTTSVLGTVLVSLIGVDPLDLAICGSDAYVAMAGTLARVDVSNPAAPVLVNDVNNAQSSRLDCGAAPQGAAVAVLEVDSVALLDANLGSISSLTTPGAFDLAIGDLGSGAEVRTCETEGCTIALWPWGASGETAFASGDAAGLQWIDADGPAPISGQGSVSVYDVDLDGHLDLVAMGANGQVTVHRSNGEQVGFPEFFHTRKAPLGAAAVGDIDGDGFSDLCFRFDDLGQSKVVCSMAPRSGESTGTDTGDTGIPSVTDTGLTTPPTGSTTSGTSTGTTP